MKYSFSQFKEIWFVDFEYKQNGSDLPIPVCMVATELHSNRTVRLWKDEFSKDCPFEIGEQSLYVTYFASAELWCHKVLGWNNPCNLIDIHVEFFHYTNGLLPKGLRPKLLTALEYFKVPYAYTTNKDEMRDLIITQDEWSEEHKNNIIEYCEADVIALKDLFLKMNEKIDPIRALYRGRYLIANSQMESIGIPLDTISLTNLNFNKEKILTTIVRKFDPQSKIFDDLTFKEAWFAAWLKERGYQWPRTELGKLKLDKDTFKDQSLKYPEIAELKEIRKTLSQLRDTKLTHDSLGRSRCFYSPFSSLTSRNQPSNSKFIFGLAKWFRHLIKPNQGMAIAYIDWSQQEFGIAAALSNDLAMKAAYLSGDPYMAFAIQAKAAPENATKQTHPEVRAKFKQCILAVQYGMGKEALASKLGIKFIEAAELLILHKRVYRTFWRWIESAVNHAMITNSMKTTFGWTWNITSETKATTLRNFHMQANGAEMIRLACILAFESGVTVCAPVHDAILIEAPINQIEDAVAKTQLAMRKASRLVLGNFELSSEAKIVRFPDRYSEEEGEFLWNEVAPHLGHSESGTCSNLNHVMLDNEATVQSSLVISREYLSP